jgi:TolB protein
VTFSWRRYAALLALASALSACGGGDDAPPVHDDRIVYEAASDGVTNVFMIDASSGESRQLTSGSSYDGAPAWSPDRTRIVFSSDRDAAQRIADIYTMAPDGSDVRRLTATPDRIELHPKYSPDGGAIAFALQRQGQYYLALMEADGAGVRELAGPYQFVEFPAWRRDGSEIYFAAIGEGTDGADVLAVDLGSGEVRTAISRPGPDVCPHFTLDGKYMTYAGIPAGEREPDIYRHDLASDDATGADDVRLTDDPARDDYANPSPDGTRFVFISHRDGEANLYLMDPDGEHPRPLTQTPDVRENVPDW